MKVVCFTGGSFEAVWARVAHEEALIELRDDLLDTSTIRSILNAFPKDRFLLSTRQSSGPLLRVPGVLWHDLGGHTQTATSGISIQSSHTHLPPAGGDYQKWAPVIERFEDVIQLLTWRADNPQQRCIYPRSQDGRWRFLRLILPQVLDYRAMAGHRTAPDQPDWEETSSPHGFSAVLGSPIQHSFSPRLHRDFAASFGLRMYPIRIEPDEWKTALPCLLKLGLRMAAVTAPLKPYAFRSSCVSSTTKRLKVVNTLIHTPTRLLGFNTDILGFRTFEHNKAALWGGTSVRQLAQTRFPRVKCLSVRAREPIEDGTETLIWGLPHIHDVWPNFVPSLKRVIDLNYTGNPAKAYAKTHGLTYEDGRTFLDAQARGQRFLARLFGLTSARSKTS